MLYIYILGLFSWLFTLIGFYNFIKTSPLYYIFLPTIILFTIYYFFTYFINIFYKTPNVNQILEKSKNFKNYPEVDIFLPVCGESKEILIRTWDAVKKLDYPKFNVYIGDDKKLKWVEILAKDYGFNYLSRKDLGVMKKTGNLNFLFSKSNAPFFVVFDADFAPDSNFLKITIPLIVEDDKIAILQTPQGFYKSDNNLEQAASDSQIDFYRIIQNSRNYFGGSICVGTNAVYRRSAISDSKVYEWLIENEIDHGEDVNTGFYLLDKGYKVEYLPVFLALGNSASNIPSLIKQRNRWASSSTRMFLSGIVYKSKITLMQKISFYSGFMYYITDSIKFSLSYMLFFVLFFHGQELQFVNAVWFLPHIIFGFIILPIFRKNKVNLESKVVDLLLVYTNMYTFIKRLFGVGANWVPTANVSHKDEVVLKIKKLVYFNFALFYIITLIMTFMNKIPYNNIQAYTVIFWIYYFVITHLILINYLNHKKYFQSN